MMRCWAHVEAATSNGKSGVGSGAERSSVPVIHQTFVFNGSASPPTGSQEYSRCERYTKLPGRLPSPLMMAQYRPIQMGNWTTMGPRQPMGLMPASLYSFMVSRCCSWGLSLKRPRMACIWGCKDCIRAEDLSCLRVRG